MRSKLAERWIAEGRAIVLPSAVAAEFDAYLERQPWTGSSLDWRMCNPHARKNVAGVSEDEIAEWVASTAIGKHSHMAVFFSAEDPCVVVKTEDGARHLDELFWESPGTRFCFGVDVTASGQVVCAFEALLQYGDGDNLVATTTR